MLKIHAKIEPEWEKTYIMQSADINPGPAEPGYALLLQTV